MESAAEAHRLEEQALAEPYEPVREMSFFSIPKEGRLLDAGCGTGLLSRSLASRFPLLRIEGCDFSHLRVKQAQEISKENGQSLSFFQADLAQIPVEDGRYDYIISRYVFEHLQDPRAAIRDLYRSLKVGGKLGVVDFDGLIANLFSTDQQLMRDLDVVRKTVPVDLFVGRKLLAMFKEAGFKQIRWTVEAHGFEGESLIAEASQMEQRFRLAHSLMTEVFGSSDKAHSFRERYVDALRQPETCLFVNKFRVEGQK